MDLIKYERYTLVQQREQEVFLPLLILKHLNFMSCLASQRVLFTRIKDLSKLFFPLLQCYIAMLTMGQYGRGLDLQLVLLALVFHSKSKLHGLDFFTLCVCVCDCTCFVFLCRAVLEVRGVLRRTCVGVFPSLP